MSILDTAPAVFDAMDWLDVADLSTLTWLTKPQWLEIAMTRERLKNPPKPPVMAAPEEPGTITTYYNRGTARPSQQVRGVDFDTRSREDVAESLKPNPYDYVPQQAH